MTAQEKEGERLVALGDWLWRRQLDCGEGFLPSPPGALASPLIDEPSGRDGHEPRARVVRHALVGPLRRCDQEGFLHSVLARVELSVTPHKRAKDLRRKLAQQVLDRGLFAQNSGGASITWRTSIGTLTKSTIREAISIARASFSTSTIQ